LNLLQVGDKPRKIETWLNELGLPTADRDYKPGHERVLTLMTRLQEEGFVFHRPKLRIRVAGTNGKGSTAIFLASALQVNQLKVGLYTSPHISNFNERIQVQGKLIRDAELLSLLGKVMPLALSTQTSYFETATVLALLHFSMQKVDVEILEAGVGAKLDATTAVAADIGILTPVALDHQDWLGNNLLAIAREKSFVFQSCALKLSTQQESVVREVLQQEGLAVQYTKPYEKPLAMIGEHQKVNAGLAWETLSAIQGMGSPVSKAINLNASEQVIQSTLVVGRLQYLRFNQHHFWLDAAHNEHAVHQLIASLVSMKQSFDVIFLCTREDRDLSMCVPQLQTLTHKVVVMTGASPHPYTSVSQALSSEVPQLNAGRFLVLGSFITLGETLTWMGVHS